MRAYLLTTTATVALLAALPARAQNATWNNPATVAGPVAGTFNFNANANWSPATVPTGTALFGTSTTTALSISTNTTIGGWTFNVGASNYTFTTNGRILTFNGAGIVINGGSATITNNGILDFNNTSTAGNATITNNELHRSSTTRARPATPPSPTTTAHWVPSTRARPATPPSPTTESLIHNTSTAGNATITNNVG